MVKVLLQVVFGTVIGGVALLASKRQSLNSRIQTAGMRLFRDLGRIKARKRRYAGSVNSVAVLLGREEPIEPVSEADAMIVDIEELKVHNGRALAEDIAPSLWLSILHRVYDVTAGWKFYGPGGKYHGFVGRDATRAFCTGCLLPECLISDTTNLTLDQIREAHRWLEYYELHDKYTFVGVLKNVTGKIDDLVAKAIQAEQITAASGGLKMSPEMLM